MRLRERLGIDERRQRRLVHLLQAALIGIFFVGLDSRNPGIVVNAGIALGVTYLPALLERDYHIPMDAGLTLWVATAVFLHALGTVGVPGSPYSIYTSVWWWDHLTHALSASVVAAVGYTAVRALDLHTDAVRFPPRFTVLFILLFTLAFGVLWEVIEFAVGRFGFLSQYGIGDTVMDLLFDAVGGLVVAVWGGARLSGVAVAVADRLGRRNV